MQGYKNDVTKSQIEFWCVVILVWMFTVSQKGLGNNVYLSVRPSIPSAIICDQNIPPPSLPPSPKRPTKQKTGYFIALFHDMACIVNTSRDFNHHRTCSFYTSFSGFRFKV